MRMLGNITASMAMCIQLARLQDHGLAQDRHSSLAKAFCTLRMCETSVTHENCSAATE
ncbi:MAG: Acyl-coenzyme oxidase 4, peroxisomal [Mycobacterium sp.]|jgi:glutaryl-CoA dehydrogenase|nr:Acyl-coenzyme oxidase 4, peroxisomal [Mycobacterium sp.]